MKARPNEEWWAQHGKQWYQECGKRREWQVYYLLQEAFLSAYFSQIAPARVLEFGCGFGRHLKYLREIPGLELHGVDSSRTMLEEMVAWADEPWRSEHTTLIKPGQRLNFEDNSFDVVFTVSVLIHIQPDDVPGILRELLRVTRGHILHVENAMTEESVLRCTDHDGCWGHPIDKMYKDLGAEVEVLPPVGMVQSVYRVPLGPEPAMPYVNNLADRLRTIDEMVARMMRNFKGLIAQRDQKLARYGVVP